MSVASGGGDGDEMKMKVLVKSPVGPHTKEWMCLSGDN